jgi:hypothetical protein
MNLEEFESQSRDAVEQTLNQLNTATLLVAQLEIQISEAGSAVQSLSRLIDGFVTEQRGSTGD